VSWKGLRFKGTEILRSTEWNLAVAALDELYGWLTDGTRDINVDEVFARRAEFRERILAEGRPVILDGDPISIYQFYDIAVGQITEAVDRSALLAGILGSLDRIYGRLLSPADITLAVDSARVTGIADLIAQYTGASRSILEQIYGKVPSPADITLAVDNARVTANTDMIAQYTGSSKTLLEQIYGKLPSREDVTSAIDSASVTRHSLDIREYARRIAETTEAYAQRLASIEEYARETRDVLVRVSIDEYGRVGVRIAEPLDVYGRVLVSVPSELLDEFKPVWARGGLTATYNTAGFYIDLYKGGRPNLTLYYRVGGVATIYLKGSVDGTTWRTIETITTAGPEERVATFTAIAYPYVRAETPTTGIDVEFELVASR
jgi:hypothetical protein